MNGSGNGNCGGMVILFYMLYISTALIFTGFPRFWHKQAVNGGNGGNGRNGTYYSRPFTIC